MRILKEEKTVSDINSNLKSVNTHPTEAQKKAGNYKMGHVTYAGFKITIENPKGSKRYWTDQNGKKGFNLMHNHYGYFSNTLGKDGDHIDVFLGPNIHSDRVYPVDQNTADGKFDETKVMLGFNSKEEAKKAYMSNYSKGWKGFRSITEVDIDFFRRWLYDGMKQQKPFADYYAVKKRLNEGCDFDENVDPESIDLSSFDVQKDLNPDFWVDGKLDSRIRMKLLDIADDFIESLDIPWVDPEDITMTGSLSNYNWSEFSDIDLHVIVDYSKVDDKTEFVKEYFNAKKSLWNSKHEGIRICGFPVEVYVQDSGEKHSSSGVYSLERDKWLVKPDRDSIDIEIDIDTIRNDSAELMDMVDGVMDDYEDNPDDEYNMRKTSSRLKKAFDRIKQYRADGFRDSDSEMNPGNLTFKVMRRNGYLDRIQKARNRIYDKMNSLD